MTIQEQRQREGLVFLVLFSLTIPAANWLIGHVGTTCIPQGPCVVPVAPGLTAPSGVMMVGVALVLRDLVQRRLGAVMSVLAVLFGSALSAVFAPASLVFASAAAFLLSEFADLAVYTPLAAAGAGRFCFKLRRSGRRLDCILVACVRLARFSGRADRRKSLDGAAINSVCRLAAPP
jgi:uncharacterized PurR-regulated membrane protein YhhQ (DUF165 family)